MDAVNAQTAGWEQTSSDQLTGAIHPFSSLARGTLRAVLPKAAENYLNLDAWQSRDDQAIQEARKRSPFASFIGQAAGEATLAATAGLGSKAITAESTLRQVGAAAMNAGGRLAAVGALSGDNMSERMVNAAGGFLGGATGPIVGKVVSHLPGVVQNVKNAVRGAPEASPMSPATQDIVKAGPAVVDRAKERLQAAKDIDVFTSPAEASGLPSLAADEASIPLTRPLKGSVQAKLVDRRAKFSEVMRQTADDMMPAGETADTLAAKAQQLYKQAENTKLGGSNVQRLQSNKQVMDAYNAVLREQGLPPNPEPTLKSLYEVRGYLLSQNEAGKKLMRQGGKLDYDQNKLKNALKEVTDVMRSVSPEANEALNMSQRLLVHGALEKNAGKLNITAPIDKVYKALGADNPAKRLSLLNDIEAAGADSKPMANMLRVMDGIFDTKEPLGKAVTRQSGAGDFIMSIVKNIRSQLTADVAAELATNNNWAPALARAAKMTDKAKQAAAFMDLVTKAGAMSGADQLNSGGKQ
jgi:hypothetical protein